MTNRTDGLDAAGVEEAAKALHSDIEESLGAADWLSAGLSYKEARRHDATTAIRAYFEATRRSALVEAPAGETRKPKQYCVCKSLTNPCIVCGLPKFIDPTWLKRKIEEDGEEGEIGAGFELFASPAPDVAALKGENERLRTELTAALSRKSGGDA